MSRRVLSREERTFVDDCRRFARDVIAPDVRRWDEANTFPVDVHVEAAKWRIPYAGFAIEDGGRGLSHRALAEAGLEMARVCAPTTFTLAFDHGSLRPVIVGGTAAQRQRWVRDLIARGGHASWCMTEPRRSGSNLLAIDARAERVTGGWVIDAEKCMVGMGTVAEVFFVFAEAFDGGRRLGPTIFAVPRAAGVEVSANPPKIGFRCLPTPDVVLKSVFVDDDAVIGRPGGGLPVLLDSLDYMRLGGGVVILGIVRGALDDLAPWLEERELYGDQRLGDTSHVQITIGRLLARLTAAEGLLFEAAEALDDGRPCRELLTSVKILAADLAIETTHTAAQLWGWRGVREDYSATKRLRDARQTSIYEGTTEVLAMNLYRSWAAATAANR
ncbi:acyl-CoA/acyl-ACP dehydrogenase [Myxococcota bacterium]|nr:acyl-CoA/acyl-ACP dehydrogenase [Myxococcota bacterium]